MTRIKRWLRCWIFLQLSACCLVTSLGSVFWMGEGTLKQKSSLITCVVLLQANRPLSIPSVSRFEIVLRADNYWPKHSQLEIKVNFLPTCRIAAGFLLHKSHATVENTNSHLKLFQWIHICTVIKWMSATSF